MSDEDFELDVEWFYRKAKKIKAKVRKVDKWEFFGRIDDE